MSESTATPSAPAPTRSIAEIARSAWPLRVAWLIVPLVAGPALADALSDRSRSVQVVASTLAWAGWIVGLGAMSVLRSASLTVVRVVGPGALAVAVWASLGADRPAWAAAGVGIGAIVVLLLAAPGVSDAFVDGSSYGTEQRVALKIPPTLLVLPVPLSWLAVAAGVVTGPLLLASSQWVAGGIALVVGAALAFLGARQLHLLSRRWLVFVPAGLVVHDPFSLTDPILFPRTSVARVGPAVADAAGAEDVVDSTGGALGLALEVRSHEAIKVGLRTGRSLDEREGVLAILVTPTQPATTLEIARAKRLPVG
ncbi:hypothetical protein [Actinospongicola halichondriae]|uniref:hypothetical protein n=1 Tax=Actinospongicola halichondriae TaxID=3236844 RepID=UPI003D3A4427